ncbi:type 4a pilus biogenesis protein PilO [Candidatus Oleimmundimicrobium sp.]|uniref:type 4a pilus biogenesis protein PilO n=1 Tax=Candidatus Oleimmundimicrobium sp. TaxID=3060597 RepID=UPI002719CC9F|nr:type 4a pilus biogenesis protein PilO [Candidatus Oleimmundimicrobium sp.]MDO8886432.1 type 4a pilus biogenesis protein PilO [Candidatus Oleimmundimicrobium sp.]
MKLKMSQKDQMILMLTGVLILMLLFAFFVVMPKINQIKDLRTQQELENNELESAKATLSRLKSLKKDSAKIEAEIAKLKAKMPENPELPSLILQINKIASDAGIDFITISPGELPEMGDSEYISVPLSITTTGRFFNLIDFLYRVRNNEREIKITSVSIGAGPDGLPHLTVSIKADAFVVR